MQLGVEPLLWCLLAVTVMSCLKKNKNEVILSSPKFISQISILLHALPPPPAKNQEGRKPINIKKIKKCKKPCKFHEQITCFLSNTFIMHQMFVVCHDSCWFHVSFGWEVILSSPSFWFHVSEGWEVILSSPSFWFHGFRRVRGNTLITLLFLFHDMLRAKTVEEVDDGYLNP